MLFSFPFVLFIVADVSSQICTITPTSPDGLDPTGGVIVDGTVNVMVECRCLVGDDDVPRTIRWFGPNMMTIFTQSNATDGDPYIIPNNHSAGTPTTLVIPTFSYSTSGVYTCGIGDIYPPTGIVTITVMQIAGKK